MVSCVGGLILAVVGSTWSSGRCPLEAARRCAERVIQHGLAHATQLLGQPVVNAVQRHVADARVPVHRVVPKEEGWAVGPCVLDATKALREVWLALQRLELRLGARAAIRDVGSDVAPGDVQDHVEAQARLLEVLSEKV
jgi:hypothetical protein